MSGRWLATVLDQLPPSSLKILTVSADRSRLLPPREGPLTSSVLYDVSHAAHDSVPDSTSRAYHRLAVLARKIAVKLSAPSRKKGSIDVPDMCEVVRGTWLELVCHID